MKGFNVINYVAPTNFYGIGGSITYGMSADTGLDYLSLLELQRNKLDQQQYIKTNKGSPSTGSWYGCIRLQTDIIDNSPDILYIEFAVNDGDNSRDKGCAEAMIRRLWTAQPTMKLCAVFFPKVTDKDVDDATNLNDAVKQNWIALCNYYNIPYVDYADYLKSVIDAGGSLADYMADAAHPTNAGHALAYSRIKDGQTSALSGSLPTRLIADSEDFENTPVIKNATDYDSKIGTWSEDGTEITSTEVDATVTFSGTFRGFGIDTNTSGGRYAWKLDDFDWVERDVLQYAGLNINTQTTRAARTVIFKVISGTVTIKRFFAL